MIAPPLYVLENFLPSELRWPGGAGDSQAGGRKENRNDYFLFSPHLQL